MRIGRKSGFENLPILFYSIMPMSGLMSHLFTVKVAWDRMARW